MGATTELTSPACDYLLEVRGYFPGGCGILDIFLNDNLGKTKK
jgi:hypothetical protein